MLSRTELADLQQHAPDVYAAHLFLEEIPFEPDESINDVDARTSLARWQFERFGRLDLRGFVRNEAEDVSWTVEDIYQDLEATRALFRSSTIPGGFQRRVIEWLEEIVTGDAKTPSLLRSESVPTAILLGHPGSGKTFFLRWLAVRMASEDLLLGIERPLPLLVPLPAYAQAPGPLTLYDHCIELLLEAGEQAAHTLHRAVTQRRAVFLLDGLDEVGDEAARRRVVESVAALQERVPGCLIVITSRIVGYEAAPLASGAHFILSSFDNASIRSFLIRWCELYARDRLGCSDFATGQGRSEGEELARDVLNHKDVRELARNPLLLTVLAIVHRSGVRLPDHRVELYDHATRVLVERWNRVRGLSASRAAPPLKAADAVRLLGPIALGMARRFGVRSLLGEDTLRDMLSKSLSAGNLRGLATPDEAISLFKNSLGLLVEQGPGLYAFMHLTLAEYFAAWELVRTGELENLVRDPTAAFLPEWREVILLASGVLGVLRADDARLAKLVARLLESAAHRPGRPSPTVPSLLGGLLADDPGLSPPSSEALVGALVPTWWFERRYGASSSLLLAVQEATALIRDRMMSGRSGHIVHRAITNRYGAGIGARIYKNLARGGPEVIAAFFDFLAAADVDYGPVLISCARGEIGRRAIEVYRLPTSTDVDRDEIVASIRVSKILDASIRSGAADAVLEYMFFSVGARLRRVVARGTCAWKSTELLTGDDSDCLVTLKIRSAGVPKSSQPGSRVSGIVRIKKFGLQN